MKTNNKKSVCLYFQVHQPTRLRQYRFFDIGKDSHYYDDFTNKTILRRIAQRCYLPMNALLLELIKENKGSFKVSFSISGSALEQFDRYAPDVIESFKALADTGCVEFLSETYYHSLSALASESEFRHQVEQHKKAIEYYFGVTPVTFRNTELVYADDIGGMVAAMGFKTILAEGAKHVLGWKSPNYVYSCPIAPKLHVLLRNSALSDDIAFRFSSNSLTADKYADWLSGALASDDIVNLFMDYETFGEHQKASTGIFDFVKYLPAAVLSRGIEFVTPSQAVKKHAAVADLEVPELSSWADEERDISAWLGNELQKDAFNKLYSLKENISMLGDDALWADYGHLQESDHLYYMCTKFFSDGDVHKYFNPYDTPYEAFINYMNVLSDFMLRVEDAFNSTAVRKEAEEKVVVVKPVHKKAAAAAKAAAKKSTARKK
ncbi:MAG: glycoside hydrolase family 57 protein [Bacteroidales bacterium]|nr:glycoside hydrolase family 57 protein [Bacteroidales bacterium]